MSAAAVARNRKCFCRKLLSCGAGGTDCCSDEGTQGTVAAEVEKIRQHLLLPLLHVLECTVSKNFANWQDDVAAAAKEDQEIRT